MFDCDDGNKNDDDDSQLLEKRFPAQENIAIFQTHESRETLKFCTEADLVKWIYTIQATMLNLLGINQPAIHNKGCNGSYC